MCECTHKKKEKREKKKMNEKRGIEKRSNGKFVKGLRKNREDRDRISFVKESNLYYEEVGESKEKRTQRMTVTGSTIPSYKTRYVQGLIGMSSDKLYGDKAYLKGMNKRPRMKLTLGNMVMRKKRKRVEGVNASRKDTRVGGQRVRQRIRVVWDRINRERRKKYKEYRNKLRKENEWIRKDEKSKESRKQLIEKRERYQVIRECEVYRNSYEVRSRYERHERGIRRKKARLEVKYHTEREKNDSKSKTWLESHVRQGRREEESEKREDFYGERRKKLKNEFEVKWGLRKQRVDQKKERGKVQHIQRLLKRAEETGQKPIQQKNRLKRFGENEKQPFSDRKEISNKEESRLGREEFERRDHEGEILRASPTTQYFAKVKNVIRMVQRQSGRTDQEDENRVKKRRKVPEKKRTQRYPYWIELDVWSNRIMQKVEDENLKKVLKGEEVDLSYATYREFGKKVRYLYAVGRTDRMDKPNGRGKEKREKENERVDKKSRERIETKKKRKTGNKKKGTIDKNRNREGKPINEKQRKLERKQ